MEASQSKALDQDRTSIPQGRSQPPHIQQDPKQLQSQVEETPSVLPAPDPSPLKKSIQTAVEPRRNPDLVVHAASPLLNPGLRKAQSVHSLVEAGNVHTPKCLHSNPQDLTLNTFCLAPLGDPSGSCPSREPPPQRPTTLPSSPRCIPSTAPPGGKPSPASPRSPLQENTALTPRKSSSSSLAAQRSYMSPTASSMAKMSRSISIGDGLHLPEPAEDPSVTASGPSSSSQVKETPSPRVAVVHSNSSLATSPQATISPVLVSSSWSMSVGNHGDRAAPPTRGLQARVPGCSRPLPDKPVLDSFSTSSKPTGSSSSLPPPVSPPQTEEEPLTPAGFTSDHTEDPGLDFHPSLPSPPLLLHHFILSSLWLRPSSSSLCNG